MWYKKIVVGADDPKTYDAVYDETEKYVKAQVDAQRNAEDTFHEILRKEKQKRVDHNNDRIKTMKKNLDAVDLNPKIRDALIKVKTDVENLNKPDPVEVSMSDEDSRSELEIMECAVTGFPKELVNVPEFTSFKDTYEENKGLVMFVRSPPSFTRASRIVDFCKFNNEELSGVVMKFDDDSVTRIHGGIVIGIKEEEWGGLEEMYRSGQEVEKGSNKRKATVSSVREAKKRTKKRNAKRGVKRQL